MSFRAFPLIGIRRPVWTLVALLALTASAAAVASRLQFDASIGIWFLPSDPELKAYEEFSARFSSDESVYVVLHGDDVLTPTALSAVASISQRSRALPQTHDVRSLMDLRMLPPPDFDHPGEFKLFVEDVRSNTFVQQTLLGVDGRATAVVIDLDRKANDIRGRVALVRGIRAIVDDLRADYPELTFSLAGSPVISEAVHRLNRGDMSVAIPAMFIVLGIIAWLSLRRLTFAGLALAVVAVTVVWTLALMGALGLQLTLMSSALLPLLIIVGVADAIHILADYARARAEGEAATRALEATLQALVVPCAFTSLTTAAGLAALVASPLGPVREFGLVGAAGSIFGFVVTMTLIPAVLRLFPDRGAAPKTAGAAWLSAIDAASSRFAKTIVVLGVGFLVSFGAAATFVEVGAHPMSWMRKGDPLRQATERVERDVGGSASVEFLVRSTDRGLRDLGTLERLRDFEHWLEARPTVSHVVSIVDLFVEGNRQLRGRVELPKSQFSVGMVANELEDYDLSRLVQEDFSVARLSARIRLAEVSDLGREVEDLRAETHRRFANGEPRVEPTGYVLLLARMQRHLVQSQISSLLLAGGVIAVLLAAVLRSLRLGALAMALNAVPVAGGLGLMPLLGIDLDPGTVMLGAVGLGIVVDDSVHLFWALDRHLGRGAGRDDALRATLLGTGPAIATTSVILGCGFLVLTFGSFAPTVSFGLVSAAIVILAAVGDLLLLPAVIRYFNLELRSGLTRRDT